MTADLTERIEPVTLKDLRELPIDCTTVKVSWAHWPAIYTELQQTVRWESPVTQEGDSYRPVNSRNLLITPV